MVRKKLLCIGVNSDNSIVNVYDSKYFSPINSTVDLTLELIKSEQDAVTINSVKMQQQSGNDACGVFAIAVATALCHSKDPQWNQDSMWQHIQQCFEAVISCRGDKGAIKSSKTLEIYCICRQRYKPTDTMKDCQIARSGTMPPAYTHVTLHHSLNINLELRLLLMICNYCIVADLFHFLLFYINSF